MNMEATIKSCILEQSMTLQQVIDHVPVEVEKILHKLSRPFHKIIMVGSGTSLNAAVAAKYFMEYYNDADVQIIPPFDFIHYFPQKRITHDTLVIGISQTARSIGTIDAVTKARTKGAGTVFVTAIPQAAGAQCAETIMDTWTGIEPVGPKTKGFTSTMAALFYLSAGLAGKPLDLNSIPVFIAKVLETSIETMPACVEEFYSAPSIKIISCGPNMSVAREGGLKILEMVRVPVEIYDVEEYMHGPYHCLENDTYMIFIAAHGEGGERMLKLIQFAQSITKHILVITDEVYGKKGIENLLIPLPGGLNEMLTPLGYIIPIQILANDITVKKGRRPEQSRYPNFHEIMSSKYMPQ
jgi:glucoselysine-6-phosphate deglycase